MNRQLHPICPNRSGRRASAFMRREVIIGDIDFQITPCSRRSAIPSTGSAAAGQDEVA
jgi:hypothetical protein